MKGKTLMKSDFSHSLPLILLATLAIPGQAALAQEALTAKSLEGVWKVSKVVTAGVVNSNPQPGLLIFTRGYYSALRVNGSEPRKASPEPKDPAKLTDTEKLARYEEWAPYAASAGTYEVKGNTMINHNSVAKMVRGMTITEEAIILKFDGNSFVAGPKPGNPNSDRQTTYTRVR
jgi:hypothetical protein